MKILLFKNTGLFGKLIGWQTRSEYCHAAIQIGDTVYESMATKGVRKIDITNRLGDFDIFTVIANDVQEQSAKDFLEAQIGKKYDWGSVIRFVSRKQIHREQAGVWFCSELVFAALQSAGIELLLRIEPWAVSPGMLRLSPLLIKKENA